MENMLGTALQDVCGPLGDLIARLKGKHGEEWLAALKRFLRKENPWPVAPMSGLKVWREVTFVERVYQLVIVTPEEFGYPSGTTRNTIYRLAQSAGLELAHWGIAHALYKTYIEQPEGEELIVASEPEKRSSLLGWSLRTVYNDGNGPQLRRTIGDGGYRWGKRRKFVFVLPNRT